MQNPSRNVMNAIKMKRLELLDIVRANKEKHIAEFIEAVADYKLLVLKIAQSNLKLAKTADLEEFKGMKAMPASPVSYEDSYRRAIRMLELSVEDIIEVEEDVFNQLVLDEWSWKRGFIAATTSYKAAF
jgi:predicted nucleic acid-binding OB-fold protein